MIAIRTTHINKSYDETDALKDLCFDVEKGELFGVIGPDGSGKSTLMRILVTLLLPDNGTAEVAGFDIVKDYRSIRKIVGYMPGRFSLYHDLTVEENLKFYATIFRTTIKENYDLISDIYEHIAPFRKRLAGRLSGGMKQKLALSCALIHKPEVLFLDEPTTGVDAVSRKEFWEMLKKLQKKGITILVSTAYMDEAARCDRIALMLKGKFLQTGTPQHIIDTYSKNLFSIKTAEPYRLMNELKKQLFCDYVFPFGDSVHFTSKQKEESVKKAVKETFTEENYGDIYIEKITPGMEDCFMELMNKE